MLARQSAYAHAFSFVGPAFVQYGSADAIHLGDAKETGFIIG